VLNIEKRLELKQFNCHDVEVEFPLKEKLGDKHCLLSNFSPGQKHKSSLASMSNHSRIGTNA